MRNGPNGDPALAEPLWRVPLRPASDTLEGAMAEARTWLNLRYRHEHVAQDTNDTVTRHANASTLRTSFGMETGSWNGIKALIEVEDVTALFGEDYNSTINGKTSYPVVADPDGTEINQVYADIGNDESAFFRLGRQEITLDNQRFIGNVGWRQNHQSFDAAGVVYKAGDGTSVRYTYIDNVNRIFGESSPNGDVRSDSHLVHLSQDVEGMGSVSAYWYDLDLAGLSTVSTRTWGLRLDGKSQMSQGNELLYRVEYADQKDAGDNPGKVDQDYYVAELGAKMGGVTLRAARESLGGSGNVTNGTRDSFSTPLATLHAFKRLRRPVPEYAGRGAGGRLHRPLHRGARRHGLDHLPRLRVRLRQRVLRRRDRRHARLPLQRPHHLRAQAGLVRLEEHRLPPDHQGDGLGELQGALVGCLGSSGTSRSARPDAPGCVAPPPSIPANTRRRRALPGTPSRTGIGTELPRHPTS